QWIDGIKRTDHDVCGIVLLWRYRLHHFYRSIVLEIILLGNSTEINRGIAKPHVKFSFELFSMALQAIWRDDLYAVWRVHYGKALAHRGILPGSVEQVGFIFSIE